MRVTRHHRTAVALAALLTSATAWGLATAPDAAEAVETGGPTSAIDATTPHVLDGSVADVLVRVRGSSVCSGTPITVTRFVLTAAHCVLDHAGDVTAVIVERDGIDHTPRAVLVNPRYADTPRASLDAAVLVMERAIPGPAATLGETMPTDGLVTVAGLQPIDADGSLLRGTHPDDRPRPKGATGGVVEITSRPAGCVDRVSSIEVSPGQWKVPCGLIPGASGGGLFTPHDRELVLLGIISTVSLDLSFNGLTPLSAVHELLNHPVEYTHAIPVSDAVAPGPTIPRA